MKKGTSPLRMSLKNSPRRFCLDGNNNFAETNSFQEPNAKDHSFSSLRPPLCPIPEANYNLPTNTNTEHDLSTPRGKCDAVTPLHRTKMFPSGQGLNQLSENTCRGSNFSTPENDLLSSSTGLTCTKNRFGWQEQRAQSSNGSAQETSLLCDSTLPASSENDYVGTPTSGVARSLKYNQAVTSSTGSLPNLPATDMQTVATIRSLPSDSKNNFVQHHFELQEDESFWDDHSVQVVIRIRPLSSIEIASQGHSRCIRQDSSHTITWLGHPESRFTFDLVAGEKITQENLFKVAGLPMVENCMGGYNSCMFAYGQTGSGKTHTMLGDLEDACQKPSSNHGMTPRVFEYLFTRIRKEEEARREEKLKFVCKCSFLEIYNEQVADLLEPSSANLQMREDAKKGVYVENLSELEVKSVHDVIRLLLQGAANRKVAATNMNRASSRSHSVFTCVIESKWESQSVTHHRFGRLNLVDLAGSERQKSSGAEGERLKEASNINKSLSTLGLVIMNLVNVANGKPQHVPYRDSKLTFLLQDSLGGNSKTTIIANVSPSNCCAMETLSTLKFAQRAKFIRNNATINEDATGDVIALRMQIQQLKEENNRLRGQLKGVSEPPQEDDYGNMSLLSSPGLRVWDSMKALASPVLTNKKRRELESALVGALKREQATEKSRKAINAENEQLKRLVKQREAEAQCTKMLLRFREEKIKRLEAVASDKLSAEAHLLKENNMLMEELQLLQNRLQRNPEVTRFAMENIRLMEQLRRFQEFYEGGEQERMTEQIEGLQVQLLEALDWKLMHQQDPNLENQKEASEGELSAITEENGFLHRQVEQYRREAEALRNNLSFCLEAKEKLERRLDDLMIQINEKKVSGTERGVELDTAIEVTEYREDETMRERLSPQKELKDLVEAISAASQREAEAQELLDDLRKKLKESVEYNERLIDMYDKITQERDEIRKTEKNARDVLEKSQEQVILLRKQVEELQKEITERNRTFISMDDTSMKDTCMKWQDGSNIGNEADIDMLHLRKEVEEYRSKLQDTSEENERLLELYEKAMQERDDIRRLWWNCEGKNASEQHGTGMVAGTQVSPGELETLVEGHDETTEDNVEIRLSMEGASDECGSFNGEDVEMEVIRLRKEGEEYQMKLKDILEENERLIDMYEKAMREKDEIWKLWQTGAERKAPAELNVSVNGHIQAPEQRKEAEQPHIELQEIAEENDRLTVLQKVSLQEKDCRLTSPESAIEGFSRAKLGEESEVASPTNDIEHFQMQWRGTEENNKMLDEHLKKESMEESKAETDQHDVLQKEVENLQMKLREMAKDNKRLFKIYEDSVQEKAEMQKLCKCMASNMQKVEGESEKEYQKLDMDFEPPQLELAGTRDIEDIPQKESSAAAVEAFSLLTGADSDQNVKTQQNEIQNFQSQLQRMTQENGKLIFMYEKATQERNELANLWERATDALKHAEVCEDGSHNAARGSQIVSGNPGCVIGSKEIEVLQESRMQTEAKVIGISEREHEDFATARVDECNAPEQANLGKNMHGNLESDRVFSFLTKEVDKLQSKMKEMAEEYESLALRYEETANEKDKIRKALQKTAQDLENSTKERSFFSREIEDLKLKLKDTRGRSQETVMTNKGTVENLDEVSAEDSSKAIDIHLGQDDTNIKVKQLKELQTRQTENETAPEMKHLKQVIALHCAENAGNLDEVWNEKKLKQLQEREHHVQQKFEEMDLKLSNVGASMDNLNVLKERLEIDLDIIHGQSLELVSSIAVKEKKLKDLQLDLECLKIRLQEAEQSRDNVCHLSTAERGKWAEKEAELQREKDLMIEHMANREKILVQELTLARSKLCSAQERLAEVTRAVDSLSLLEKSHNEMDKLRKETDSLQLKISQKKQEIESLETCADQMHGKKIRAQNKFSALKTLLADLSASEEYWKCRESRANAKVETFACLMKEKMKEMGDLQADKKALEAGIKETLEMEAVALAEVHDLKEKLQLAEQQRVDAEKTVVLLDKQASSCTELRESAEQISVHFGKAASLLKGEEERMKLFTALKKSSDIVKYHRAKTENLEAKSKLVDSSICQVQSEIETASAALKDAELALQRTLNEKQMLIDSQEEGKKEMDILILELQFSEFEVKSKEEELKNSREDLQGLMNRLAELQDKNTDDEKSKQKLELEYCLLSQLLLVKLKDVHTSIWETEASLDSLQLPQNEVFKELDV